MKAPKARPVLQERKKTEDIAMGKGFLALLLTGACLVNGAETTRHHMAGEHSAASGVVMLCR
ncbi:hypothetical protein P3W85_11385 [Cupriavidus basilensis]|uniref:Uncharacterized protein n=1 Tax=Cupriavidus basilensis TaxID=68895 RepID=A0ABT6ALR6_9BURK|nr:hypothetical protein [Cupriavidus basilensis]MDF3833545.1 hypothetical protein [Cupriavidus basilensis]